MRYTHNTEQANIFNFKAYGFNLEESGLYKMGREIDWDATIALIEPIYSKKGRNSNSIRTMMGLEIAKTYYKDISDKDIVGMLRIDVSLMIFCGFEIPPTEEEIPSSNSMTDFRNRLTKEVVDEMNALVVREQIKKLPSRKRTQVASDSTCLPANIRFPTDTGLLSTVAKKLIELAGRTRKSSKEFLIRGKGNIKKQILKFNKKRRKAKGDVAQFAREMLKFSQKLQTGLERRIENMTKKQKEIIEKSRAILDQQTAKWIKGAKKIPDRIVSFYDQNVRPIFRGKAGSNIEFGKKASIQTIGGKLVIPGDCKYNSFSDTELPERDVKRFKQTTGRKMKEYSGDMGLHSQGNHDLMEMEEIVDGIAYRGKISKDRKLPPKQTRRRLHRQRQPTEGYIGVLKRRYGCSKIRYKSENTDIRFGLGCMLINLNFGINN